MCLLAYDLRTKSALDLWLQDLPQGLHAQAREYIADAAELAARRWRSWCEGSEPEPSADGGSRDAPANPGAGVVGSVGSADPEHPRSAPRTTALHLQHYLTRLVDNCAAQGLVDKFTTEHRKGDLDRLSDLSSQDSNHDWLWAVHPNKGNRLATDEYVEAVRLRLGCGGPVEPALCKNCGTAVMSCNGEHGLLCAKGESTKGHNAIRDQLHDMASSVDRSTELEPTGLIASRPQLRPADTLTGAFHNGRLAAVDVGVICPAASGAGLDCVQTMDQRKRDRMAPFAEELAYGAVEYHPFAVSCWGRLHPSAEQMLRNISKRMARREGLSNQRPIEDRLRARITTEVMRRAARMVLRCLPAQTDATIPDDLPIDHHAECRAGDPATLYLPPYDEVPPSGTPGALPSGAPQPGAA
jgi:hypothetical protein